MNASSESGECASLISTGSFSVLWALWVADMLGFFLCVPRISLRRLNCPVCWAAGNARREPTLPPAANCGDRTGREPAARTDGRCQAISCQQKRSTEMHDGQTAKWRRKNEDSDRFLNLPSFRTRTASSNFHSLAQRV